MPARGKRQSPEMRPTIQPQGADSAGSPAAIELETPTHRGDVIAALLCLAVGLAGYFIIVPSAVYVPSDFAGTANSPAFLPNLLFLILTALSVFYLTASAMAWSREDPQGISRVSDWFLAGGTVLICVGYVIAIHLVGMTLGSALCIIALIFYFGERRAQIIGAIAVILPLLLWYFFVKVANILLPTPVFPFMEWLESSLLDDRLVRFAAVLASCAGQVPA